MYHKKDGRCCLCGEETSGRICWSCYTKDRRKSPSKTISIKESNRKRYLKRSEGV